MNKEYRAKMTEAIKQMTDEKLSDVILAIGRWKTIHGRKKSSYLWSPPSSASSRRYEEKRNTFEERIQIGEDTVCYWSDCRISCNHFYWKDGLYIVDSDVKINFADLATLEEFASHVRYDK